MPEDKKRITHQFLQAVHISEDSRLDRVLIPVMMGVGILYGAVQVLQGDWPGAVISGLCIALLLLLATNRTLQRRALRRPFNRRHALYIALLWGYSLLWLALFRALTTTPPTGKDSQFFYVLVILFAALNWRILLTLFTLTGLGYRLFITEIPIWEQLLVAINEMLAAGLLAYAAGGLVAQILQPNVFTLRLDPLYMVGLIGVLWIYYLGMQVMWVRRWNDWLSQNDVWVWLARLFAPLALVVLTMEIVRRFSRLSDPRTADLLGGKATDLAVLALAPVVWLVLLVITFLVYTSTRGLRERFLPDDLLEQLPSGLKRLLSSISDMDILLILGLLATSIPGHFFLLDDETVGFLDTLRQQIFQRGSGLIQTSEQARALLFAFPFYLLIVAVLVLYAYVISRSSLPSEKRNQLVTQLPNSLLIILIITLYLCAIPFTQVLTEGRLPRLPQDTGKILAFYILIPLLLLYAHYFLLVRIPYGRGQSRWRERAIAVMRSQLVTIESSIQYLSERIQELEKEWRDARKTESPATTARRLEILYRLVEINSERDGLNMNKLRVMGELQELTEHDLEIPLALARLPIRVVQYGIPLLLAINIYQWAVVGGGLREIIENPNINIIEFFRIILQQTQF